MPMALAMPPLVRGIWWALCCAVLCSEHGAQDACALEGCPAPRQLCQGLPGALALRPAPRSKHSDKQADSVAWWQPGQAACGEA